MITAQNIELIETLLTSTFGKEWFALTVSQQWAVADDFNRACCSEGISSSEYKARIYEGNLEAYAKCLLA